MSGPISRATKATNPVAERAAQPALTARQKQMLDLISVGHTNSEIASLLCVGLETVKTHVAKALACLGARNRAHAVALYLERNT